MIKAARIKFEGVVQGVGFRPFVHRIAQEMGITGFVLNTSTGVEIHAQAPIFKLKKFYQRLKNELPPLTILTKSKFTITQLQAYPNFSIRESKKTFRQSCLVSPDISICPDCHKELFNKINRRYLYPFINCTNCGPRFSIIQNLPYDRALTTMKKFKLCPSCDSEFLNLNNRRYHAQPNACAKCGPETQFIKNSKIKDHGINAIKKTIQALKNGALVGIKGIGGFHIACDAYNFNTLKRLRQMKNRPDKPFALMVTNIEEAKKLCQVSQIEKTILESPERPIVLLKKKSESTSASASLQRNKLNSLLAPDNNYLGIMLCYTPLHYLLFSSELSSAKPLQTLIMTSANIADEPIEIKNNQAIKNLRKICDYFLIHNREIHNRCDDSIIQIIDNRPAILRRARGYAPFPFLTNQKFKPILACGAELKNTFCLTKDKFAFLSQYIGDLKTCLSFDFYKEAILRLSALFKIKPKIVCHDLHPNYLSTKYCQELALIDKSLKIAAIQHHHAHLASVISEHQIKKEVIGACFDGIGYGEDGKIWGGEFFAGNLNKFQRLGHLEYIPMPGQDKATQQPYRMAISYLYNTYAENIYNLKLDFLDQHKEKLKSIITAANLNPIFTSSVGRLFDAVSALLGICDIITYEAQAAIKLQCYAEKSQTTKTYSFLIDNANGVLIIKSSKLISEIVTDLVNKVPKEEIARKFHNSAAFMTKKICGILREKNRINIVCLCGGVFQNKLLLEQTINLLRKDKFQVYYNELLPANDGAISLGQAAIANAQGTENKR